MRRGSLFLTLVQAGSAHSDDEMGSIGSMLTRRSCTTNFTFTHKLIIKKYTIMVLILFLSHGSFGPPNWYDTNMNPFVRFVILYIVQSMIFVVQLYFCCLCIISKRLRWVEQTRRFLANDQHTFGFGDRSKSYNQNEFHWNKIVQAVEL